MKNTTAQIRLLVKVVYLLISLLLVSILFNILLFFKYQRVPEYSIVGKHTTQPTTASWRLPSLLTDIPADDRGKAIRYGYQLITQTPVFIGPRSATSLHYAGNNLACNNCHLDAGRKIGSGSFVGVSKRFPQFRGRENKMGSLEDRINGCLERSMNGKAMPVNSPEMQAMVAYMDWLSDGIPKEIEKKYKGYVSLVLPIEKADSKRGKLLYQAKCAVCHQANGHGIPKIGGVPGYLYPPLAGSDSFNDGAGMHRVITAAQFIKANMPFGASYDAPQLSDEEAYHISAYINSLPRPEKLNKQADFPDRKLKPVSTPYGPWADPFSAEQHTWGPFQPIMAYYEKTYHLVKKK